MGIIDSMMRQRKFDELKELLPRERVNVPVFLDKETLNTVTPLFHAAVNGDDVSVEFLVRACSADLDWRDSDDRTPLHRACARGHIEVVRTLLRLGCVTNVADAYGFTPISVAALYQKRYCQRLVAMTWTPKLLPLTRGLIVMTGLKARLFAADLCLRHMGLGRDERLCVLREVMATETDF